MNWTYTYEGFVYKVLNKACRVKDSSKITTLGAYSYALSDILFNTCKNRVDINPSEFSKCWLFRGSGLTEKQIQEFRDLAKTRGKMRLYGYTSTSKQRSVAESFAFSNKDSGIKRVLYCIHWEDAWSHYLMNGAFDYEEEILLSDGAPF